MKSNNCLCVFNKSSLVLDSKFLASQNYALRALGALVHGVVFLPLHFMQLILMAPVKSILTWKIAPLKESDLRLCRTLVHIPALLIPSKVKKAEDSQIQAYQKVIQNASWRKKSKEPLLEEVKNKPVQPLQRSLEEEQKLTDAVNLLLGQGCSYQTYCLAKDLIKNPELANSLHWTLKNPQTKTYSVFFIQNGKKMGWEGVSTRIFCVKPEDGGAPFIVAEIPKAEIATKRIVGRGGFNTARLVRAIDPVTLQLKHYVMKKKPNGDNPSRKITIGTLQKSFKQNPSLKKCFALPCARGSFLRECPSRKHHNMIQDVDLEEVYLGDLRSISSNIDKSDKPFEALWSTLSPLFKGLNQLHELGLSHNDIKPENIFLSSKNKALLGDWDIVNNTKLYLEPFIQLFLHSEAYLSIELRRQNAIWATKIKQQNDIWALGLVIVGLLFRALDTHAKRVNFQIDSVLSVIEVGDEVLRIYIQNTTKNLDEKKEFIEKRYLPELREELKLYLDRYEDAFKEITLSKSSSERKYFNLLLGICRNILLKDNDSRITAEQIMKKVRWYLPAD